MANSPFFAGQTVVSPKPYTVDYVAAAYASPGSTSTTVTLPAGLVNNDVIIAYLKSYTNVSGNLTYTCSTSGWTDGGIVNTDSWTTSNIVWWTRYTAGVTPSTANFRCTSANAGHPTVALTVWRGCDPAAVKPWSGASPLVFSGAVTSPAATRDYTQCVNIAFSDPSETATFPTSSWTLNSTSGGLSVSNGVDTYLNYRYRIQSRTVQTGETVTAQGGDRGGIVLNLIPPIQDPISPTITTFTVGTPTGTAVPITSFDVTDGVGVTGYMVTTTPSASVSDPSGVLWRYGAATFNDYGAYLMYFGSPYDWVVTYQGGTNFALQRVNYPSLYESTNCTATSNNIQLEVSDTTARIRDLLTGTIIASMTASATTYSGWSSGNDSGGGNPVIGGSGTLGMPGLWYSAVPQQITLPSPTITPLWAWAKDAAGNMSTSKQVTVVPYTTNTDITFIGQSETVVPTGQVGDLLLLATADSPPIGWGTITSVGDTQASKFSAFWKRASATTEAFPTPSGRVLRFRNVRSWGTPTRAFSVLTAGGSAGYTNTLTLPSVGASPHDFILALTAHTVFWDQGTTLASGGPITTELGGGTMGGSIDIEIYGNVATQNLNAPQTINIAYYDPGDLDEICGIMLALFPQIPAQTAAGIASNLGEPLSTHGNI